LSEFLKCPGDHEPTYCVVAPDSMEGRRIVTGEVACPVCERHYPIRDGVGLIGPGTGSPREEAPPVKLPQADAVQALLGLASPGGYVVLLGRAADLAAELAVLIEGVHFVAVNAPLSVSESGDLSLLESPAGIPLRDSMARGVVVGTGCDSCSWLSEAARVLLKGRRLVLLSESDLPPPIEEMARGDGMTVGQKP
jgi:uncharacterized protein YbaR (Trm112 family)